MTIFKKLTPRPLVAQDIKVGDRVQWTSQGAAQFAQPRRVTFVSPDGQWVLVEGSCTGLPAGQVTVVARK